MQGLIGIPALLVIAWALSENRRRVNLRTVVAGVLLQLVLALLLVRLPEARSLFLLLNRAVEALQRASEAGTGFVFGYLGGGPLPFAEAQPGAAYIFAFRALPLVLLISALASLLFHLGILQRIVQALAWVLRRAMGVGGALGLGAAVHIFVGHIEAPLLVRPYLQRMQRGELFALMSCGMAGIAGTMMVIYAAILGPVIPDALANVLVAAVVSTPAALAVAALMVPFESDPRSEAELSLGPPAHSAMEAIARGTADGVGMLLNIVSMLIVAIALVALVNEALELALPAVAGAPLTLQRMAAWLFRPVVWLIGIPGDQVAAAAQLMGTKTVLNEFVAYVDLAKLPSGALDDRSRLIMTYALCGFANFGSAGIMIGGMTAMAPERKHDIVGLGLKSIVSGSLATSMSGALVGLL